MLSAYSAVELAEMKYQKLALCSRRGQKRGATSSPRPSGVTELITRSGIMQVALLSSWLPLPLSFAVSPLAPSLA